MLRKYCISGRIWAKRDVAKQVQFFPNTFGVSAVFSALKLEHNCYMNMDISFYWKMAVQSWIGSPSLFYKYTVAERLSLQYMKPVGLQQSNFSTP